MALRDKWTARLKAEEVGKAAKAHVEHHEDREQWWEAELKKAEADLRANGIELREMPVTGGNRLEPMFDPQKRARVEECRGKVRQHREEADRYHAYYHALNIIGGCGDGTVEVDVADIQYFGLHAL